jgi:hypothetical protein
MFEASAKAHNQNPALYRNAEALLPSAKAGAHTKQSSSQKATCNLRVLLIENNSGISYLVDNTLAYGTQG